MYIGLVELVELVDVVDVTVEELVLYVVEDVDDDCVLEELVKVVELLDI